MTQSIDSVGRTFTYNYAANNIDLTQKLETRGTDDYQIAAWTYNSAHLPLTYTDGSGQVTNYTYNYHNQLYQVKDANSDVWTYFMPDTYTATIGGTVSNNHVQTITVHNTSLTGGTQAVTYTELTGDTLTTIAAGLAAAINANANLQNIGVTATSSGAVITLSSNTVNQTTYTKTVTGSITITISSLLSFGYLTKIQGPLSGNQDVTTFSYDGFGRLYTATDSEGYTLTFSYDSLDRPTQTLYPDGTTEQTTWSRLDPVMTTDRIGRCSQSSFDNMDRLIYQVDPLGRKTQYTWCTCGSLTTLTDPLGHVTTWQHDLQGRTTEKILHDQTSMTTNYDTWSGRVANLVDALGQTKNFFYNEDSTLYLTNYQNSVNATGISSFLYDQNFSRLSSATKGDWGTLTYTYNPYFISGNTPTTGGGMLQEVQNNVISNSATTYSYDVLGRTTNRSINSTSNSDSWTYDAMSRITGESNVLGSFSYAYVDDTSGSSKGTTRLASVTYPNSQVTNYSWYPTLHDERLQQIANLKTSTGATISQYSHLYDSSGQITQWQQLQNNSSLNYSLNYDQAGQLLSSQAASGGPSPAYLKQNYYAYDLGSNRIGVQGGSVNRVSIGGTVTATNTLTITVHDAGLSGGQQAVTYTVQTGDTLSSIAAGLAANISANANLQSIGVSASTNGAVLSIRSSSPRITTYTESTSGGATETITLGVTANFVENAAIGGTTTTNDVLTVTVKDPALTGGTTSVSYTVLSTDTLATIATGIKTAINGNTSLSTLGVTATAAGAVVTIKSTSSNATTYAQSTNSGATETITLSINQNGPQTIALAGSKTTSDVITVNVYDAGLSGGTETITYTVLSGDTLTSIASGIASAINADTNLQAIGVSATSANTVVTVASNSVNATTLREHTSSGATEIVSLNIPVNGVETAAIGGSKTTGDTITITTIDAGLSGGSESDTYTVLTGDTLSSIATGIAAKINGDSSLSAIGVTATATSTVVNIKSASTNATTFAASTSTSATETVTLGRSTAATQYSYNNVNELVGISVGGSTTFQGTANKALISATVGSDVVTISQVVPISSYSTSVSGSSPTETLTAGTNTDGNVSITVGGTVTTGDVLSISVFNTSLSNGEETVSYTVLSGDTTSTIATGLKAAINADTHLQSLGLNATTSGAVIAIAVTGTTFTQSSTGGGATVTLGFNNAGNTTAAIGGTPASGNTITVTVHNPALSGGQESATYTLTGTDTVVTAAAGLAAKINADTSLQAIQISATSQASAALAFSESFSAQAPLAAGTNTATVSATDGASNTKTNPYNVYVTSGTTANLTFDANGNMTSDGTNSYTWDTENRLIQITYPGTGNNSQFTYDGLGNKVKIVETSAGSVTSTKQFVCCGSQICEERNASSAVTKQFFGWGQTLSGSNYFYTRDHLGSVRDVVDSTGTVQAHYEYDMYGQPTQTIASQSADFGYAGMYFHAPSGLNLATYRAYSPSLGRWINRDPAGERAGANLYQYAANGPTVYTDPLGLDPFGELGAAIGNAWNNTGGAVLGGLGEAAEQSGYAGPAATSAAVANFLPSIWLGSMFPQPSNNGPGDALRHCIWACKITQASNPVDATKFLNRHEQRDPKNQGDYGPAAMDMNNNSVGVGIGSCPHADCFKNCLNALNTGGLFGLAGPIPAGGNFTPNPGLWQAWPFPALGGL